MAQINKLNHVRELFQNVFDKKKEELEAKKQARESFNLSQGSALATPDNCMSRTASMDAPDVKPTQGYVVSPGAGTEGQVVGEPIQLGVQAQPEQIHQGTVQPVKEAD